MRCRVDRWSGLIVRAAPLALAVVTLLALCLPARAESLRDVFLRGNAAYARGDFAAAVKEYEALHDAGIDDPDLAFNLASAYGTLGKYGQAIRFFERSLRLDPGDGAARAGLRAARDALGEKQAQESGEAIVVDRPPLTEAVFSQVSEATLSVLLLVSIWLGSGLLIALPHVKVEGARLGIGIASAVLFSLSLVSALGVGAKASFGRAGTRAVVVAETAAIREGPDDRARLLGELVEGESVRVLSREGSFARVLSRGEREAYVRAGDVGEI